MSGATVGAREITIRGVVLGALITLVFTAANVYLGLRVGLTFATSIPAAVISMGVLRLFANHSVVENNIVQTIASAAGTLSSIIFVLPALLMIGWWSGFPYWTTAAVCALGGILGVMYSIPLRRALVTGSDLPYPEGVAGAEVLKIGDSAREMEHNRRGIGVIALGAAAAAGYALLASLRVINNSLSATFRVGSGATMIGASLSLALIGVGHLVGVTVGVAMIVGLAIAFGVMLPIRTAGQLPPDGDYAVAVARIFSTDVRFIGAGAIAVAAAWTFLKILGPILRGIADAAVSARTRRRGQAVGQTERDIPIHIVAMVVLLSLIPIGWLLADFTDGTPLDDRRPGAIAAGASCISVQAAPCRTSRRRRRRGRLRHRDCASAPTCLSGSRRVNVGGCRVNRQSTTGPWRARRVLPAELAEPGRCAWAGARDALGRAPAGETADEWLGRMRHDASARGG
ncbi:OPT family oligopeptide transporter [Mycobacterium tuberculosis UT0060]|nr:OPT family oligopeptide transporter [Mycobacterium tuberculosis UT0060]